MIGEGFSIWLTGVVILLAFTLGWYLMINRRPVPIGDGNTAIVMILLWPATFGILLLIAIGGLYDLGRAIRRERQR